ncbi:MAG TPA: 3-phosphoshikimate 1-carboxyvinyltransferase [Mycobacteriales bacterium]|nr:3-phosphoshikimate 1-carboxyvinyltransferase [Mycobacteriales bacterium]
MSDGDVRAAWAAPRAAAPVRATVTGPGSKSVTNRALVLAALADGPGLVRAPLRSRDTELMAAALRALGVSVDDEGADWRVTPQPLHGDAAVDVGLAGTVMRFVPPVATLSRGRVRFDGDARARERPVGELLSALRQLGAEIDDADRGALPFDVVGGGGLRGGTARVDASTSSQIVSALMLTGACWEHGVRVEHVGERSVPNAPHLAMSVRMLRARGVAVDDGVPGRWAVPPGPVAARDEVVEPDLSSAAPFLAAAVVTGGSVSVTGWPRDSCQPGAWLPGLMEQFGATSYRSDDALTVTGSGTVGGIDVDLRDAGELTPVVAAIAAVASGPSRLTGIGYLRGHETDRLAALACELGRLGAEVSEEPDGLRIRPRPLRGAVFRTYDDHRLAMAAAVLGLVVPGVLVENIATTAKTYPRFVDDWLAMLAAPVDTATATGVAR